MRGFLPHYRPRSRASMRATLLHPLDRQRQTLADAYAQSRDRAPSALLRELMGRGQSEPRARHAERMAERDGTAVRIDVLGIVLEAELTRARWRRRREVFIDLDQIKIGELDPEPLEQLARRGHRAQAH